MVDKCPGRWAAMSGLQVRYDALRQVIGLDLLGHCKLLERTRPNDRRLLALTVLHGRSD
jgi:hypothetical protein